MSKHESKLSSKIPMWLDCDVGHDDAMALILAAYHPSIKLLGVSSVSGNSSIENTTANAIRVIQAAGIKGIKVYRGAAKPLIKNIVQASDIHGVSGLDGTDLLPIPDYNAYLDKDTNAVNAMRQAIMISDVPVSIAAVGPLTNIALLVSVYPEVIPRIKTLSIMGGSMGVGNVTAAAEFNIFCDPEAAHIVIHSGIEHIALVPLDVTHTVVASKDIIARINKEVPVPMFAQLISELLLFFSSMYANVFGILDGPPLHDPIAVAYLFMRDAFTEKKIRVDVDCTNGHGSGRTFCDIFGKTKLPSNCWLTTSVDIDRFWDQMLDALIAASKQSPFALKQP
ncbi:Uridine nucleosidase 1 [Coemansia erecta]|nr:Uridine nucleosidase 1 [Coemansia erecta]KAJ2885978.1 Uridine nucleosidase 1 [Coemansia asiatica]